MVIQVFSKPRDSCRHRREDWHVAKGSDRPTHFRIQNLSGNSHVCSGGKFLLERKPKGFELSASIRTCDGLRNDASVGLDKTRHLGWFELETLIKAGA